MGMPLSGGILFLLMRALIIGCGYVGSAVALRLAEAGHVACCLSRGEPPANLAGQPRIEHVRGDITDPAQLSEIPRAYDWIVNCAASSGGGVDAYRATYLQGTRNILDWLAASFPLRYVYTSSTGVYGQNDGSVVTEESPTDPQTETGRILLETEHLLLSKGRTALFPAIILRLAGIYGAGRGYWLKQFLSGEARVEGDGSRVLNMIHRDDVVGAILAALERGRPGEIYNVVDHEPVEQRDLLKWLAEHLNQPMPATVPEAQNARKRGVTSKRVANSKLRNELRYSLIYPSFREGFIELLRHS